MASSARLDELKKKFEENPRRYFAPLANEHRKSGDLDQAIAICRTHLPQQPGHISGHIVLAQALFESGSFDESRESFHTALGLDPENLIALRYLGDIAKESADIETARSWYQRVLDVDPRNEEIVQLVRDLDAPPAAAAAASPDAATEDQPRFAPPTPSVAPEPVTAADRDARFAPLSLDDVDLDGDFSASEPAQPAAPNDARSTLAPNTYDGQAGWGAESGTEMPVLDTPELDPFDLDPAASVESLYDPAAVPAEDYFLTDLVPPSATTGTTNSEAAVATDPSADRPSAEAPEPALADIQSFEADAFYLEPPPPEPVVDSDTETVDASAEPSSAAADTSAQTDMPGMDAFAAEYSVPPDEPAEAKARSTGSHAAVPTGAAEPNAEPLASLAEQQTAEWEPPPRETAADPTPVAASDDLGLEVMEFVPPSREPVAPTTYTPLADADPILGRTLPASPEPQGSTPAAFVTETMAELYLQQGFRNEALAVYRELLAKSPADASLRDRIDQIESGSMSSIGMASVAENVVESALKRQHARPSRSVRSFFASFAGRRAPRAYAADVSPEVATESFADADAFDETSPVESAPLESPSVPELGAEPAAPQGDDRMPPLASAAETLATFDPFADAADSAPPSGPATGAAPNAAASTEVPAPAPAVPRPTPLPMPSHATPSALANAEPPAAHRSLEDLFPDTPLAPRTEAAAQTLATAFGRTEPQGRPTRAASNELSLDHVFRGAPEGAPAPDGGFSFDQFFSDSRVSNGDASGSASTAPDSGRGGGPTDAHDIEQFTAWLEGLKKK